MRFGARAGWRLTIVLAVASLLAACELIIGLDKPKADPAEPIAEAGQDVSTPDGTPPPKVVDPCDHVYVPARGPDDDPTTELPTLSFATHIVHLTEPMGWDPSPYDAGDEAGFPPPRVDLGFDLDHGCTCQKDLHGGGPSCRLDSGTIACDADGGVDDGFTSLFELFGTFGDPDQLSTINTRIASGDSTFFVTIDGYNGRANDGDVTVHAALVTRPASAPAPGCTAPDAGPRPVTNGLVPPDQGSGPAWDGCDQWQVVRETASNGAYVVGHRLVVTAGATLPFQIGTATVNIRAPIFVSVLVPHNDGTWSLEDGQVGARAPASDLFAAMLTFHIRANELAACYYPAYVTAFTTALCPRLDIMSSSAEDFGDAGDGVLFGCDSLSFGYAFRADPAVRGSDGALLSTADCADSGVTGLQCP